MHLVCDCFGGDGVRLANYPVALPPGWVLMLTSCCHCYLRLPRLGTRIRGRPRWRGAFDERPAIHGADTLGVREKIFDSLSPSLKSAIAVGIGLFIAFIGFKNGGLVIDNPATLVAMNHVDLPPDVVVFLVGLGERGAMLARG